MKKLLILISLLILAVASFKYLSSPVSSDTTPKNFVINQGDGLSTIATRLEKTGFVRNRYIFMFYAYRLGLNKKIQAGMFKISNSLNSSEIAMTLSKNGTQDYWLKIIEGTRVEEFAPSAEFLSQAKDKEGYLFPDSYLIPQNYSASQILEIIGKNFDKKLSQASLNSTSGLSTSEAVTLASILEREANTLTTKQMISGILQNRLKIGMALQVDATIQYAHGSWAPLTKSDLSIKSPYNTYLNPGLPPTPICNPGYDSLYAAFHPTESDYMYYISDTNGQMHYAKTLSEHNANVTKYLK